MAEPKTKPTEASVDDFIAAQPDVRRRADCQALVALMSQIAGAPAVMWGAGIIGFGRYELPAGGHKTNPWPRIAFAPRKSDLTLYLVLDAPPVAALLPRLGPHKTGKVCLYLKRLSDVDTEVLGQMVQASLAAMAEKYGE